MTERFSQPALAAVDWGTSSFRLWLLTGGGAVVRESRSNEGMIHCSDGSFAQTLQRHLDVVRAPAAIPVIICGMAGARQGWVEAPYLDVPTSLDALPQAAVMAPQTAGRDIRILPGLRQHDARAPNVMRGEETQLFGVTGAAEAQLVCMPGTHCKWVALESGTVVSFQTYMTGELFAVLGQHSILRHALVAGGRPEADDPVFLKAFDTAFADPGAAWFRLFEVRPAQLLGFEAEKDGAAHLSGLLIGAELGAASNEARLRKVTLVAETRRGSLGALYASGLDRGGFDVTKIDSEEASRRGLLLAARQIWELNDG